MYYFSRFRNHAFLDYFKTSNTLQGREKSIHHQLDDERKKYLELQNKRKMCRSNETEELMPVTNVITHVRKPNVGTIQTNYSTIGEEMLLECKRLFQNDDSTTMRCRQIENARRQQNCSVDCTLDKKELNTKKIVRTEKSNSSNTDIKIDETCKCCGTALISSEEKTKKNPPIRSTPNNADLQHLIMTNKYPFDKQYEAVLIKNKSDSKSRIKHSNGTHMEKNNLGLYQPIHPEQRETETYKMQIQNSSSLYDHKIVSSSHNDNSRISDDLDDVCIKHKEQYSQVHKHEETIDNTFVYEIDLKYNQGNEQDKNWMEEAKSILIKMGENIKIINDVDKRNSDIEKERLASWSLAKWKCFTENNKNKRHKLEKIKVHREQNLMRRYFYEWKQKTNIIIKEKNERAEKIDMFLDVLRSRQEELKENLEKKRKTKPAYDLQRNEFKNRLNIQKDIIKSQKQKLAEAEEEIQKMKIRQILEQNKISRNVVEENVRETIQNIDPKVKVAANQIIKFKNDEKRESHEKAKKLVESMEQRAKERKLKWQEIQERKKQKAEAKVKLLEEQEAARLQEEEEKKKKRIIELKEKRRVEQENARKKENERRRLNSLSVIAENFHKKKLKQRALRGFRENLESCLIKMELADKFYIYQLKRKCFMAWKFYTEEITAEKEHLAAHFYNYILKRRVFDTFKEVSISIQLVFYYLPTPYLLFIRHVM